MNKPRLFISHASQDGILADTLKKELEKVFAKGLEVFCTSSPGDIHASEDWLQRIEDNLRTTQAVIVVITPVSIEKPWLWFEIGATWLKGKTGDCKIYPICAPAIDLGHLPSPLDRLQAMSFSDPSHLKMVFQALIEQFGFGNISAFRADNIIKRIPDYKEIKPTGKNPTDKLLTAPTPDVRVSVNSGYTMRPDGPAYLLAIEVHNYSSVVVYINHIYIEAQNNSILSPEADYPSGDAQRPTDLHPGKSLMLRVNPKLIKKHLSKGLRCAAARDQIGRIYRSSEEEFSQAIHLLFDYYLK